MVAPVKMAVPQPLQELSTVVHLLSCLSLQSSCPTGAYTVASPPFQPPWAAPQGWHFSQSSLRLGRTSHPNPRAYCRKGSVWGVGWKKESTNPWAGKIHQFLSFPQSPTIPEQKIPPILTLEISVLKSSAPKNSYISPALCSIPCCLLRGKEGSHP